MSLARDMAKLDALVAALGPEQRDAMRTACVQIAAALQNLGTAVSDGIASPIAEAAEAGLLSCALSWRPGKGFGSLKPKMIAALNECPALRAVAAEFIERLTK